METLRKMEENMRKFKIYDLGKLNEYGEFESPPVVEEASGELEALVRHLRGWEWDLVAEGVHRFGVLEPGADDVEVFCATKEGAGFAVCDGWVSRYQTLGSAVAEVIERKIGGDQ